MKICMVSYSFYLDDSRIQQYASALAKRGDHVDIVALRRPGAPKFEVVDGVNLYSIQSRTRNEKSRTAYFLRVVRFLLHAAYFVGLRHLKERYQLIHVHSVPDFLVFAAFVPKLTGTPVILDIHDILPEFYASKFNLGSRSLLFKILVQEERLSAAFANHVIVANELWQQRLISRSVRPGKCTAIRNHPDLELFRPGPETRRDGKFVILYPGTLNWHQGLDVAIKAMAKIKDLIPEAEFHIYGEGPERARLMELASQLGLDGRVRFNGLVSSNQIARVMAQADLAVVPKRASSSFGNEAASTKIMEFMALGVPVVASRTKIDTYYFNDSMVKFFESENDAKLVDAILSLKADPQLRKQLVSNALKYVEENNWEKKKLEYLRLVDSLTRPPKSETSKARTLWLPAGPARGAAALCDERRFSRARKIHTMGQNGILTRDGNSGLNGRARRFRADRLISLYAGHPMSKMFKGYRTARIPILMYHGIRKETGSGHPYFETNTSPEMFACHMKILREEGYAVISLDEAAKLLQSDATCGKKVALTFDDGYRDFYTEALPVLTENRFKATLFVPTGRIGDKRIRLEGNEYLTWSEVRELRACGIRIGSHTVTHPEIKALSPAEVEREVRESKAAIEDNVGESVKSFSYPFAFPETRHAFTRWLADTLEKHGYENGVSTIIGTAGPHSHRYFLPRLPVNNWDDPAFFKAKLEGGYSWLHLPQRFYKAIKLGRLAAYGRKSPVGQMAR